MRIVQNSAHTRTHARTYTPDALGGLVGHFLPEIKDPPHCITLEGDTHGVRIGVAKGQPFVQPQLKGKLPIYSHQPRLIVPLRHRQLTSGSPIQLHVFIRTDETLATDVLGFGVTAAAAGEGQAFAGHVALAVAFGGPLFLCRCACKHC